MGIDPLPVPDEVMGKLTAKAVAWLEENHQSPFFLYFAPNAVHAPVTPSKDFHGSPYRQVWRLHRRTRLVRRPHPGDAG